MYRNLGEVPSSFSKLLQLRSLSIANNRLTGLFMPHLQFIERFNFKMCTGNLSECVELLPDLKILQVSNNVPSGKIQHLFEHSSNGLKDPTIDRIGVIIEDEEEWF